MCGQGRREGGGGGGGAGAADPGGRRKHGARAARLVSFCLCVIDVLF